jgi:hypothetical protein
MSITQLPRTKGKRIALGDGEKLHVGIDVHKSTCHLTLWSPARGLVTDWVAAADTPALVRSLASMRPHIGQIVYETGPTGFTLARALRVAGLRAAVDIRLDTPDSRTHQDWEGERQSADRDGLSPCARGRQKLRSLCNST